MVAAQQGINPARYTFLRVHIPATSWRSTWDLRQASHPAVKFDRAALAKVRESATRLGAFTALTSAMLDLIIVTENLAYLAAAALAALQFHLLPQLPEAEESASKCLRIQLSGSAPVFLLEVLDGMGFRPTHSQNMYEFKAFFATC